MLLLLGFVFTFFIPGFVLIETFFPKVAKVQKQPLYMLLSVLVSTYIVYFISLLVGFSKFSILITFSLFLIWLGTLLIVKKKIVIKFPKGYWKAVVFGIIIFFVYLIALYPAIFTWNNGNLVMSSVNWQDTVMHLGIIESISQGNFPPQAPYYAGVSLNYYYFTDFHSSILVTLFGQHFPRVLVFDNPLFVLIFTLSVYSLALLVTKKKSVALISSFLAVFYSNFIFVNFIDDLINNSSGSITKGIYNLLSSNTYSMEYNGLFRMANMADYFLQNRPMMVGLSVFAMVLSLTYFGLTKNKNRVFLLVGLITALVIRFQFFAFLVSCIAVSFAIIIWFDRKNVKVFLKRYLYFLVFPAISFLLFGITSSVNDNTLLDLVRENASLGAWNIEGGISWHVMFILTNFGLPFLITLVSPVVLLVKIIQRKKVEKGILLLSLLAIFLFIIPYIVNFTIYEGDMFKFFYFMVIPVSVVSIYTVMEINIRPIKYLLLLIIIISSTTSSFLTLGGSYFNKNTAYSYDEYMAGIWIRENTPQGSIFLGMPTVHSPITQIGGRLRVLSYINWPYSHGYNSGEDNVFTRLNNINDYYSSSIEREAKEMIHSKYSFDYVYYGKEEKSKHSKAEIAFDTSKSHVLVYNSGDIKIYKLR